MAAKNPKKAEIIAKWYDAQAKGLPMTKFCEEVKGTDLQVTVGGLRNWVGLTKGKPIVSNSPGKHASVSGSRTALNFMQEFELQYEQEREQKLHLFLQNKVKELEVALAAAQGALREHEQKMGIIPASIDE